MTVALIDDQLLGAVLRGRQPRFLTGSSLYTTGYWYVRLCQAVLHAHGPTGVVSRPFAGLPESLRERAISAVVDLSDGIGLLSLRELAPTIARHRQEHQLNILGSEALAAALHLEADVELSTPSPRLEQALRASNIRVEVRSPSPRRRR